MSPPLAKELGSNDKKTRDKALKNLRLFLSDESHQSLPDSEMQKLWKGIFYCYWMSDDRLVQQALSSELADLLLQIHSPEMAFSFLRGFWTSTLKEWNGIDRFRMDKYYSVVRKYVLASFMFLIKHEWKQELAEKYNDILTGQGGPLCPDDTTIPSSLVYHLADIYLDEMTKALTLSDPCRPAPIVTLLRPFVDILSRTPSKITFSRIKDNLLDPLLNEIEKQLEPDEDAPPAKRQKLASSGTDYEYLCSHFCSEAAEAPEDAEKVKQALLQVCFDAASHSDTRDANRRKLYNIWRERMQAGSTSLELDSS